ncbi:hypothetical protein [Amycolatopsis samaneae]|uniref:Restriction endonuclease type IV Mrr domain-containing protein n=1 Tax=Amycolatopsis samaneae TaxID=664691 RepID=A0ABW5GIE8_9PSEU
MITVEALRGYILEEMLARFLRASGYNLLVSAEQDPDALKPGAHGLLVRGRGADHQADVLGELALPTPFSLPLRVFVEAKYRGVKANLRDVRNAHGVVHDVNEQYATATAGARRFPMRRHHYRYALFSASGFTRPAQQYALAQQISLVDLSGPAFTRLLAAVDRAAREVHDLAREARVSPFPRGQLRTALRLAFDTWTADESIRGQAVYEDPDDATWRAQMLNQASREPMELPMDALGDVAGDLARYRDDSLALGFPAAPFVLVLRPDDPQRFRAYVDDNGADIRVRIEFAERRVATGDWVIVPTDGSRGFQLRFALPTLLEDWLLSEGGAAGLRARDVKTTLLSSIALFLDNRLVRLLFEPRRRG